MERTWLQFDQTWQVVRSGHHRFLSDEGPSIMPDSTGIVCCYRCHLGNNVSVGRKVDVQYL